MKNQSILFGLSTLIIVLLMISSVSAWEIDNIKSYDAETKTATITNAFGLGDVIAKATLDTPQINYVMEGSDRRVAEITIDSYSDYSEFIKGMELTDINTDRPINREVWYKYKQVETYEIDVNDYKEVCSETKIAINGSSYQDCSRELVGKHTETRERVSWIPLEKLDIKTEKITIGIYTDVYTGDNVEWIPTLFGVKVNEWAVWTASLNVGLITYYAFEETGGSRITGQGNNLSGELLSVNGGTLPNFKAGKIGNAINFTEANRGLVNMTNPSGTGSPTMLKGLNSFSVCFWVYVNGFTTGYLNNYWDNYPMDKVSSAQTTNLLSSESTAWTSAPHGVSYANRWQFFCSVTNSTTSSIYINGTWIGGYAYAGTMANNSGMSYIGGTLIGVADARGYFTGLIDEMGFWNRTLSASEINDLWNGGAGLTYGTGIELTAIHNLPINATITIDTTPDLSCNFTAENQNISSVKLNVWDSLGNLDYTNTESGLNQLSYNKIWTTSALTTDTYNWGCVGYGDTNGANGTSGNRSLTIASFVENSRTLNFTTYQTAYEGFTINVNGTITSATLFYNNVSYPTTQSGSNWNANILIPSSSSGNQTVKWNLTSADGTSTSTISYQYVYPIDLVFCNSTSNVSYLNITYQDELTSAYINGTLAPLDITYYLFNSSSYKTLSYTNTSILNPVYRFCLTPSFKTLIVSLSGSSSMTGYPVRSWSSTNTLTNTTTVKSILLLGTGDGLYQNVVVVNSNGNPIVGAIVTASTAILGNVDTRTTDSGGGASLWLDPNKAYVLTTSADGFPSDVRSINPSATTITIALGGTSNYPTNFTTPSTEGILYSIQPTNSTLYNETTYDFKLIITTNKLVISEFGFTLLDSNGSAVATQTSNSNGGTLTASYNVLNNTKIIMDGYYIVNGTTTRVSKTWIIMNSADTQYSIFFLKNRIITYLDSGFFGLTRGFGLNLFCFIIIFITIGTLSWKYGITNETIISIMTFFLVFLFEQGLGLIYIAGSIPLTLWVGIIMLGLLIKEGLKVI